MLRPIAAALFLAALAGFAAAQDQIHKGKVKKVDAAKGVLIVTADGKDFELHAFDDTRFMGRDGKALKDGLRDPQFKEGASVMFKAQTEKDRTYLVGVRIVDPLAAVEAIQAGKIKTVDVQKGVLTVTPPKGKDLELTVNEDTRYLGADGTMLENGLRDPQFKEGAPVMFKAIPRDGKTILIGVRVGPPRQGVQDAPKIDTARLKPLTEMGTQKFEGSQGGLYPGGKNERPAGHEKAGLALAKTVQPLAAEGQPSASGKIGLLSVGMSNTTQVFSAFKPLADADDAKNPRLMLIDGVQGGMTAARIQDADGLSGDKSLNYDATKGPVTAPWLSWGPYLWANGMTKRADGFFYEPADFAGAGTHPSMQGQQKVAQELLRFFKNDTTTRGWFVK